MDKTHGRLRLTGLGGFALLVSGGLFLANCSSSSSTPAPPAASSTPTTVHYYSVNSPRKTYNANGSPTNSNAPPAPGDYFDSTATDYSGNHSSHSSSVAATDHLGCTFTSVTTTGGTAICEGQFAIGNSMLLVQHASINYFTATSSTPPVNITGGTGQYEGVHGTVTATPVSNTHNSDVTITFSR